MKIIQSDIYKYKRRILVAGTRNYELSNLFVNTIKSYIKDIDKSTICFISGAAETGADRLIINWCIDNDYDYCEYLADWNNINVPDAVVKTNRFGKKYNFLAGYVRNALMAKDTTELIAFHNGVSGGTKHMIACVNKLKLPVTIINI